MSLLMQSPSPISTPPTSPDEAQAPPPKRKSGGNKMPRMLPDGSELVWPEELEAALFEGRSSLLIATSVALTQHLALALYPPMPTRRPVTVYSDLGLPTELGNVGRCQLIQEYILKKTGKLRSRKQVASRLQRLRQTYKNDARSELIL